MSQCDKRHLLFEITMFTIQSLRGHFFSLRFGVRFSQAPTTIWSRKRICTNKTAHSTKLLFSLVYEKRKG